MAQSSSMLFVVVVPEALCWTTQLCSIRPPTHLRCAHVASAQSVPASEGTCSSICCAGQGHRRGVLAHPRAGSQARGGQGQPLDRALWHGGRPHALRLGAARLRPRQGCSPLNNLLGMAYCSLNLTLCALDPPSLAGKDVYTDQLAGSGFLHVQLHLTSQHHPGSGGHC